MVRVIYKSKKKITLENESHCAKDARDSSKSESEESSKGAETELRRIKRKAEAD